MMRMLALIAHQRAADGVHQMGFAHPHAAVDEQRVVAAGGLVATERAAAWRELIAGADDEAVEGEFGVQRADCDSGSDPEGSAAGPAGPEGTPEGAIGTIGSRLHGRVVGSSRRLAWYRTGWTGRRIADGFRHGAGEFSLQPGLSLGIRNRTRKDAALQAQERRAGHPVL